MTPDEYLNEALKRYQPAPVDSRIKDELERVAREWAGKYFSSFNYSGSTIKLTAVKPGNDVDFLISLVSETPASLQEIYESLFSSLEKRHLGPRRQNVSIGLTYRGAEVDLTPGRLHGGGLNDHSLYRRRTRTWMQTNIATHIKEVRGSGRTNEIKIMKIWRGLHRLDFPSFYLEMTVIDGLRGKRQGVDLAQHVQAALEYIANNLRSPRVVDPANSNNIVSEDLTDAEKGIMAAAARESAAATNWRDVIWW